MAKTIAATVSSRVPLGGTKYAYFGTLTPDAEYETAGDTITKPAAPALTLPEKIDYFNISGNGSGKHAEYVPSTGKVKLLAAGNTEEAAKADLSAQTYAFICVGD